MLRFAVFALLLGTVFARSIEQERLTLDRDAEFVPRREIDAVEVPAKEPGDGDAGAEDEGRQLFPRVRIFRFPPLFRTAPTFPDFFGNRRPSPFNPPSSDESDLFSIHDLLGGGGGVGSFGTRRRVTPEETEGSDGSAVETKPEFDAEAPSPVDSEVEQRPNADKVPPPRRPAFPSLLTSMFDDFNRRMQSFEDDISNLFRTLVRVPERIPADREPPSRPVIPAGSDAGESDVAQTEDTDDLFGSRPGGFGFGLFRPFRPFGGNGGFFPFRNPSEFPNDYKNSTSETKVINGTKIRVNETIIKGGDDDSSHFVHFKVIHLAPENEDAADGEQGPAIEGTVEDVDVEQKKEDVPKPVGAVDEVSAKDGSKIDGTTATTQSSATTTLANSGDDAEEQHRVDLSHILPESPGKASSPDAASGSAKSPDNNDKETQKQGLNPEDFGYQVGDNEIGNKNTDVEVINLPSGARPEAELPTGKFDDVPKA